MEFKNYTILSVDSKGYKKEIGTYIERYSNGRISRMVTLNMFPDQKFIIHDNETDRLKDLSQ